MKASCVKSPFGRTPAGEAVHLFTLTNRHGLVAKVASYGTILTELLVPDRQGRLGDVVLGFDNLDAYLKGHPYFGCTTGRVANRIAHGRFTLEGKTYSLAVNNGPNHLHGGLKGFDKVVWKARPLPGAAVAFRHTSPDGEEGYPGALATTVVVALTDENALRIDYTARTDAPTILNLTNHSYFNLAGRGTIHRHKLTLAADFYTPPDADSIPTGEILRAQGTPLDFTKPAALGARFDELATKPVGYDHNFVLRGGGRDLAFAARVEEPRSGRVMEVWTTEPGVQLYTANWLDGSLIGKGGTAYVQHAGLCLETQHFPDSINQPHFPTVILRPGQTWRSTTVHRFSTS